MTEELRKPTFIKVKDLQNGRSGYNVYVKVVSVEKSETPSKLLIARAVVADQTGSASAFFKGDTTQLIQQGKVIAIRNGTIKLIKNKISLEIDLFGRITPESVDISPNIKYNISDREIERRPRRRYDNEPTRRQGDERRPRRQGDYERRPRREGDNDRRPQREGYNQRRPQREGDNQRKPRREGDYQRRPRREDDHERKPRREGDYERKPREGDNERKPRGDYDRRPRRQGDDDRRPRREDDNERRPRREFDNRGPRRQDTRGDRRPPTQFSKIGSFEPGDDNLNFFAQVLKVEPLKNGNRLRVVLGDETGIVKAFLYKNEHIQEGQSIVLFRAEARVTNEHIEVQLLDGGKVDAARRKVEQVNEKVDISAKEWVEANQ